MSVILSKTDADKVLDAVNWSLREFQQIAELMDEEGIPRTFDDGSKLTQAQRVEMYVMTHRESRVEQYKKEKEKLL